MNDFDDLLGDALSSRAADTPGALPNANDSIGRARHHRAVRRTVAISCVGVLTLGGMAGLMLRSPSGGSPSVADGPGVEAPSDATCAAGQVLSADGDVLLHEGRPYAVAAGQCITATPQEPTITTCEVSVGSADSQAGVVSGTGEGKGCVTLTGEPCPALPLDATTVTTIILESGELPPDVSAVTCAVACGGFSVYPGPAMTPDGPVMTAFVDANSDGEFDSGVSDDPPNVVVEACAAATPLDVVTSSDAATATTIVVLDSEG